MRKRVGMVGVMLAAMLTIVCCSLKAQAFSEQSRWSDLVGRDSEVDFEADGSTNEQQEFWCEIARIYELDERGERIAESLAFRDDSEEPWEYQLKVGKEYELEVDIYNDSERNYQQGLSVEFATWQNGHAGIAIHDFAKSKEATLDCIFSCDEAIDVVLFVKDDFNQMVPNAVYRVETKGEESEHRWDISELESDEAKFYDLSASLLIPETSAQTIILRFQVE